MLASSDARKKFLDLVHSHGLEISALSCHGNSLHPNAKLAKKFDATAKKTIKLASLLGVKTVVDFSGCPGDGPTAKYPNWVTCPWPPDFISVLEWQWEKKVIPYWKQHAKFAKDHGVRIAIEMHPGFVVYSPETMMKLRKEVGPTVGANLDPSHLFWQGIDPVESVRYLGKAVHYVHAKDTKIHPSTTPVVGVLDTKHYGDVNGRSWLFRTCGYGHGREFWAPFISELRVQGYDSFISIEHEDGLMSSMEGFTKAVEFLRPIVISEKAGAMWWA
jgi:sugar phosphate isomerase/epimerase